MEKVCLQIISFTLQGEQMSQRVKTSIQNHTDKYEIDTYTVKKECKDSIYVENLQDWAKEQFRKHAVFLFIGACGIAVRTIAPYVKDKLTDNPVLVMDEAGQFLIPILSGHMGGANVFAGEIAAWTDATPVITTATDIHGELAIDTFAKNHNLAVNNREGIAEISSRVLEKKSLTFSVAPEYASKVDVRIASPSDKTESLLNLIPREYVVGIGCRKGIDSTTLEEVVEECLRKEAIIWKQVRAITTIDIKKDEKAILMLAQKNGIAVSTFSAEELADVEGEYTPSAFVKKQTGVDNVCERAAMAYCKGKGELILRKTAKEGVTVAIAKKDWRVTIYEE